MRKFCHRKLCILPDARRHCRPRLPRIADLYGSYVKRGAVARVQKWNLDILWRKKSRCRACGRWLEVLESIQGCSFYCFYGLRQRSAGNLRRWKSYSRRISMARWSDYWCGCQLNWLHYCRQTQGRDLSMGDYAAYGEYRYRNRRYWMCRGEWAANFDILSA